MTRERATAPGEATREEVMAEELGRVAIPADVRAEMVQQHRRFGASASRERWITVMTEELGEIARAYLHEDVEDRPVEMSSRQELVQLTAICLRALDDWHKNHHASEDAGNDIRSIRAAANECAADLRKCRVRLDEAERLLARVVHVGTVSSLSNEIQEFLDGK